MISWIKGELVISWQANNKYYLLIDCHGLGYEIQTLKSVITDINSGKISKKEIILWLKHIKKEDSDFLFGFSHKDQRDFFVEILNIKGIGSQIGMSLLNKLSLMEINKAIKENDKKLIGSVQGIGQKMTDRIILELKSKLTLNQIDKDNLIKDNFSFDNKELNSILEDIDLTLQSLNYPKKEINDLLKKLIKDIKRKKSTEQNYSISFENLLKDALNYLNKNSSNLDQ